MHGELRLDRDVDLLVLDPSFQGTDVERTARELPLPFRWHHGFRLHVVQLATLESFRGPKIVQAGRRVAQNGWLDARIIGEAARAEQYDVQTLKRIWHCVARFGHPWPDRTS